MRLFRRKPSAEMSAAKLNNYIRVLAIELRYQPPYFWLGGAAE